ncbi:MAG TPA: DUF4124 domain-containing protein [Zoogloea sp.]|uniref:DUF4124 domain-containing protein n=1 Tax=Zoogloea sp. TaxID=49181 RepID=UPI002C98F0E9|nr:DUF4124 domain-containing protein [Zoogloea sp.]HMV17152.1 DUF4124 domain-containing protein [Rhodocyclaceae bacterium]HMV62162.1 DUF4124 domain-containing protein [Rhodocyclaceae bacterium]HMW52090.1 DUF4124 domain-containing protein [Rhodocyclaceae bacterium]HMY49652.1 DUF4124 domain-containing protein [Rhodocyclaceae bacterium]HMZ75117.1 DUF4124 domain-containing protein [Rhodocyclaceae bacterium]
MSRALLALLILGASPLVLAQSIYSWKDAAGITHYSDTPPADSTSRRLKQAPLAPPPTAQDGATQSFADKELAFRKRRAEAAEAEDKARKDKARDEDRQRECAAAKSQLAGLESGQRIARFNAAGEKEYLDDAQRDAEIERARRVVENNCKPQ